MRSGTRQQGQSGTGASLRAARSAGSPASSGRGGREDAPAPPTPLADSNNPYHRGADLYELNLSLPIVSAIRRQEARTVAELIAGYADPGGRALEIGPGTGFYTVALARAFREVVAVEDSARMADILRGKLRAARASNVKVVNQDFLSLPTDGSFEIAVAIGVLDYIRDAASFVARMCLLARRAVIISVPQRGLWGSCFVAANRLRGTAVFCHHRQAFGRWAPEWRCTISEVGLKTPFTRGLTLVATLERP